LLGPLLAIPPAGAAETIESALVSAYRSNPRLEAERARQRALDEEVARARAGYRPTISASADYGAQSVESRPAATSDGTTTPHGYAVTAVQPVYRGLRTLNAEREARETVHAGQENLRALESSTLLDAATAYADVVGDTRIVELRQRNVGYLTRQARAVADRSRIGEGTRTDVAQAEARRARAVSALDAARASLETSRAVFGRIVGRPPGKLAPPNGRLETLLPRSEQEAVRRAEAESPAIHAAYLRARAAAYTTERIRGELLPEVQLQLSHQRRFDLDAGTAARETSTATLRATMPILESGEVAARVRQSKHTHDSRLLDARQAETEIRASTIGAWARLAAARSQIVSTRAQVEASRVARDGVTAEERAGQRSLLDVLDAEQEVVDAELALIATERDLVVAAYSVLAVTGQLTATGLRLPTSVYDPTVHAAAVRDKWFGLDITHADGRRERLEAPRK
jgi:outer membrane protein